MKFGYARVSSKDQNLDRQIASLLPYVGNEKLIFTEEKSGKNIDDRKVLQGLMLTLSKGTELYVHSLDRLGRNKSDIKNVLDVFHEKGVIVRILDLPTTMIDVGKDGITSATLDMVNKVLIEVLGYVAETERKYIKKRQAEGIEVAKAKGKHLGRKFKQYPETWQSDYKDWKAGKCTAMSLIKKYKWAPATFYNRVKLWEAGKVNLAFEDRKKEKKS